MKRWTWIFVSLLVAGCPRESDTVRAVTCQDACRALSGCAAHFGYDLSDTIGTEGDCIAACEGRTCGAADAQSVIDCVADLTCTSAIDEWGISALACRSGDCDVWFALPVGACDRVASSGTCTEYLGTDTESIAYGRAYCPAVMQGTWVPSCPAADRIAACVTMMGDTGGSRNVYYTLYGGLEQAEIACRGNSYFHAWTTY